MEKSSHKHRSYLFKKKLGEGSYGTANLVEDQLTKKLCVIKAIYIDTMSEDEVRSVQKEAKILEKLEHPNITRFIDLFMIKNPRLTLNIVMEYADGGDLKTKLKEYQNKGKYLSENRILDYFTQIALAIKHIHDRKILHRDLKTANIFLTSQELVKLGDFGVSKCLDSTLDKASTFTGTPYYLCPEILDNTPYSFKSDIWALGIVLYELCTLKVPFEADNLKNLSTKIKSGNYKDIPKNFSKELRELLASLLKTDPSKRPTIKEILKLKILKDRIKFFLNEQQFDSEFSHTIIHNYKILEDKEKPKLNQIHEKSNYSAQENMIGKSNSKSAIVKQHKEIADDKNEKHKGTSNENSSDNYKIVVSNPEEGKKDEKIHSKFKESNENDANYNVNIHKMMAIMNKIVLDEESADESEDLKPNNSAIDEFDNEEENIKQRSKLRNEENHEGENHTDNIFKIVSETAKKYTDSKGGFDKINASKELVKVLTDKKLDRVLINQAIESLNEAFKNISKN